MKFNKNMFQQAISKSPSTIPKHIDLSSADQVGPIDVHPADQECSSGMKNQMKLSLTSSGFKLFKVVFLHDCS